MRAEFDTTRTLLVALASAASSGLRNSEIASGIAARRSSNRTASAASTARSVPLAIFGVIVYEFRTVLDFVGVELPIIPYRAAVLLLAGAAIWYVTLKGGWRTDPDGDEPA